MNLKGIPDETINNWKWWEYQIKVKEYIKMIEDKNNAKENKVDLVSDTFKKLN